MDDDESEEDEDFVDDGSDDSDEEEEGEEEQEDMSMVDESVDKAELKALSKNEKTDGKRRKPDKKWYYSLINFDYMAIIHYFR